MARKQKVSNRYEYKTSRAVAGLEAQTVGEELERIREVRGELTPPVIVHESRPEEAVLHDAFEWNDVTAAHEYRLHQARNIVSTVTVIHEDASGKEISVPGFISVKVAEENEESEHASRQYVPADEVAADSNLREQFLRNIRNRLMNLRLEYQSFNELTLVWEAIDKDCSD